MRMRIAAKELEINGNYLQQNGVIILSEYRERDKTVDFKRDKTADFQNRTKQPIFEIGQNS